MVIRSLSNLHVMALETQQQQQQQQQPNLPRMNSSSSMNDGLGSMVKDSDSSSPPLSSFESLSKSIITDKEIFNDTLSNHVVYTVLNSPIRDDDTDDSPNEEKDEYEYTHDATKEKEYQYTNKDFVYKYPKQNDDESTFLDVFGERAKIFFTQHLIPPTDVQCRWNWRMARCEPHCTCSIQYLVGDYHLGRACRFRPETKYSSSSSPSISNDWKRQKKRQQLAGVSSIYSVDTLEVDDDDITATSAFDKDRHDMFLQTCHQPPNNLYTYLFTSIEKLLFQLHHRLTHFIQQSIHSIHLFHHLEYIRTWFYQLLQDIIGIMHYDEQQK